MATCPMCRKNPTTKTGKTCGDGACKAALTKQTRENRMEREDWERRYRLYGATNEWIAWEQRQRR